MTALVESIARVPNRSARSIMLRGVASLAQIPQYRVAGCRASEVNGSRDFLHVIIVRRRRRRRRGPQRRGFR